jgi:hypothetical protein
MGQRLPIGIASTIATATGVVAVGPLVAPLLRGGTQVDLWLGAVTIALIASSLFFFVLKGGILRLLIRVFLVLLAASAVLGAVAASTWMLRYPYMFLAATGAAAFLKVHWLDARSMVAPPLLTDALDGYTAVFPLTEAEFAEVIHQRSSVYGAIPVVPVKVLRVWWERNPYSFRLIRDSVGATVGYSNMLALTQAAFEQFRNGALPERHIVAADIVTFAAPAAEGLFLYVAGIGCSSREKKDCAAVILDTVNMVVRFQQTGLVKGIMVWAVTSEGTCLAERLGMQRLPACLDGSPIYAVGPENEQAVRQQAEMILDNFRAVRPAVDEVLFKRIIDALRGGKAQGRPARSKRAAGPTASAPPSPAK